MAKESTPEAAEKKLGVQEYYTEKIGEEVDMRDFKAVEFTENFRAMRKGDILYKVTPPVYDLYKNAGVIKDYKPAK